MADLKAGSLNVEITADNKRLEKGLKEAEQKVKQTDRKLEEFGRTAQKSTEQATDGFFEAKGSIQEFQSQLSAALGVISGFVAFAAIGQGIIKGFEDSSEAVEKANTQLEAAEIRLLAIGKATPVLGQVVQFGEGLGRALGRASASASNLIQLTGPLAGLASIFAPLGEEEFEKRSAEEQALIDAQLAGASKQLQIATQQARLQKAQAEGDKGQEEFLKNQIALLQIEEERRQVGLLIAKLEQEGFSNLALTLRAQADNLKTLKLETLELEKQKALNEAISATVGGTTAIGAFKTAASIAKSSATVPQSSPAENAQVSLLEEANRLLGQLVSGQGTAFA